MLAHTPACNAFFSCYLVALGYDEAAVGALWALSVASGSVCSFQGRLVRRLSARLAARHLAYDRPANFVATRRRQPSAVLALSRWPSLSRMDFGAPRRLHHARAPLFPGSPAQAHIQALIPTTFRVRHPGVVRLSSNWLIRHARLRGHLLGRRGLAALADWRARGVRVRTSTFAPGVRNKPLPLGGRRSPSPPVAVRQRRPRFVAAPTAPAACATRLRPASTCRAPIPRRQHQPVSQPPATSEGASVGKHWWIRWGIAACGRGGGRRGGGCRRQGALGVFGKSKDDKPKRKPSESSGRGGHTRFWRRCRARSEALQSRWWPRTAIVRIKTGGTLLTRPCPRGADEPFSTVDTADPEQSHRRAPGADQSARATGPNRALPDPERAPRDAGFISAAALSAGDTGVAY